MLIDTMPNLGDSELVEVDLASQIAYLNPAARYFRNSREGWHCENFHMLHLVDGRIRHNYIKKSFETCSPEKAIQLTEDHEELRRVLGDIVPAATFIHTSFSLEPNNESGMLVLTEPVDIKYDLFDLSDEKLIELASIQPQLAADIHRIADAMDQWKKLGKILDLSGEENLVLNTKGDVQYIDSFDVFFDATNEAQHEYLTVSLERLERLKELLG